jgi:thiazolinyl imide reductase
MKGIIVMRKKIVLCGVNYGSSYIPAIRASEELELAAILARGSQQSRDIAGALDVPLYLDVSKLPADIQLACVAVGSDGAALACELLARGVHVFAEHPMQPTNVSACIDAARASNRVFQINAHWGDLPAPNEFIVAMRVRRAEELPLYLVACVMPRSVYSVLDVLGRALGRIDIRFTTQAQDGATEIGCRALQVQLSGIPTVLVAQTEFGAVDDGRDMVVTHSIMAAFRSGALALVGASGPVIWTPSGEHHAPEVPVWSSLGKATPLSQKDFARARLRANAEALYSFVARINGGSAAPEQENPYLLDLSRAFTSVVARLGPLKQFDVGPP